MPEHTAKDRTHTTDTRLGAGNVQPTATPDLNRQLRQTADEAKDTAKSVLNTQKDEAAHSLEGVAHALRQTCDHLRSENQDTIAYYAESLASQVENLSSNLERKDIDQIWHDVENFARRRPEIVIGGAVALGFLAARFLKSQSPYRADYGRYGYNQAAMGQGYGRGAATAGRYDEQYARYREDYTRRPEDYGVFGDPTGTRRDSGAYDEIDITERPTQPTRPDTEPRLPEDE
jgi:hypothetical protein